MPPTWKKIAEDKSPDHPEYGKEHRTKWQVGSHTVSTTKNIYGLHIKVDSDMLINTTPQKAIEYAIRKTSKE